jgi:opacity protein-like surface antigen
MYGLRRALFAALFLVFWGALLCVPAQAQVVPAAYRGPQGFWVGAEYSYIRASFPYQSNQALAGAGVYFDDLVNGRLGLEGDARFLHFGGYLGSTESSYLVGPKGYFLQRGRFSPYAKFLVGVGQIHYPYAIGNGSYFALAPGAGLSYRLSHHWMLRSEYEYQMWLDSPGYAGVPDHELTPNGFHLGVGYRITR